MIATNKIYKNLTELFGERKVEIDTLTLIAFGNFHNLKLPKIGFNGNHIFYENFYWSKYYIFCSRCVKWKKMSEKNEDISTSDQKEIECPKASSLTIHWLTVLKKNLKVS